MTLRFEWEWVSAPEVRAPELAATWASLLIEVGEVVATLVEDRAGRGAPRRRIDVSTYPLAEWIAYHWWSIVSPTPARGDGVQLSGAADGFPWPELSLQSGPGYSLARLSRAERPSDTVRFLTGAEVLMAPEAIEHELRRFVEETIRQLADAGVEKTPLQEEWAAIVALSPDEVAFCRTAAALALDPFDLTAEEEQLVLSFGGVSADDALVVELAAAAGPGEAATAVSWAQGALGAVDAAQTRPTTQSRPTAPVHFEPLPIGDRRQPWLVGYERAKQLRLSLGLVPTERMEIEELVGMVDVGAAAPTGVAGLAADRDGSLAVAVPKDRLPHGERFAAARALGRRTFDPRPSVILSNSHQEYAAKVERAFAAELLAPAEGIAEIVGARVTEDRIARGASTFGVSSYVVEHQLDNQVVG